MKRSLFLRRMLCAAVLVAAPALAAEARFLPARQAVDPPAGARQLCRSYAWACAPSGAASALGADQVELARQVSRTVNRQVREISDADQYGQAEVWALPTLRGGDCEDFALLKKRELVARGLPPERLLLASVLDRRRNPHAVLVLRTDAGDLILDNLTDKVRYWDETGYTFLRMQDPRRAVGWVAVLAGGVA